MNKKTTTLIAVGVLVITGFLVFRQVQKPKPSFLGRKKTIEEDGGYVSSLSYEDGIFINDPTIYYNG